MQLMGWDDEDTPIVLFDSRWAYPELLGYEPKDPQYKSLRKLYKKIVSATNIMGTKAQKEEENETQQEDNQ